jgi:hypothetical protein
MGLLDDELLQSRISATPRNPILGLLSDFLAKSYSPERTQQMQGISKLFMAPEISQTLDRLSYDPSGRSLFTGAGGLGGTTRMRPEALDAVLAVAPMAAPAARLAGRGAKQVGKFVAPKAGQLTENYMQSMGMMPSIVEQSGRGYKITPQGQYQVTQPTPAMQTWGGFSSEADYAAYQQAQKNQAERMKSAWTDVQKQDLSKMLPFETGPVSQRDIDYDRLYKAFPGTLVTPSTARTMLEKNMLKASKQEKDLLRKYIDEKGEWIPNTESRQPTQILGGPLSQVDNVPPSNVAMQNVAEYNVGGGLLGDAPVAKATGIKKKSQSVISQPRMSAAEAKDAGYWHSIGAGKKLPIPISEMTARLENAGLLSPKLTASPEAMQNAAIFPFHGDRSAAGKNLLGIGDTNFETPVYLEGGYDFMRANAPNREIWAADKGSAQGLQNRIDEAAKIGGGDVFGVYSAMGPDSMNFNTMMSDALLEQIRAGKISKKNIAAFDKEVASLRPEWKGVMNPESRAQLESNGALRHVFVNRMQLDDFQKVGFPNIAYTRYGITDPLLLNEPMYSGGLAIGKMQPGSEIITNPMSPHKTYNTQLTGDYIGGFEQSVPKEVLYPDWYKKRRMDNTPISGDVRSFQLSNPIQPTNQEWLDGVMQYLANQKSLLE